MKKDRTLNIIATALIVFVVVFLFLFFMSCSPKYVTTTQTKTDTVFLDQDFLSFGFERDTSFKLNSPGLVEIALTGSGWNLKFTPSSITINETTEEKIPRSVFMTMIRQIERTERTLAREREKTIRDSLDNERIKFKFEINALKKMFDDSMKAKRVQVKQEGKTDRVEIRQENRTERRKRNWILFLIIGAGITVLIYERKKVTTFIKKSILKKV